MIKLIKILKNTGIQKIHNNYLILSDKKDLLKCVDIRTEELIWNFKEEISYPDSKGNYSVAFSYEDYLFIDGYRWIEKEIEGKKTKTVAAIPMVLLDVNRGVKALDLPSGVVLGSVKNGLALYANVKDKSTHGVFNLVEAKSLWEKSSSEPIPARNRIVGDYIVRKKDKKEIIVYNFSNGDLLWRKNLTDYPELKKELLGGQNIKLKIQDIIGLFNEKLYLSIYHNSIIILDVQTGNLQKIIRKLPEGEYWSDYKGNKYFDLPSTLDAKKIETKNKIVGFNTYSYWELDMVKDELSFFKMKDYFDAEEVYPPARFFEVYEDRLLFFLSDAYNGQSGRVKPDAPERFHLCVFDMDKKRIIYKHNLQDLNSITLRSSIIIQDNWLLLHDVENNSFIFEIKDMPIQ